MFIYLYIEQDSDSSHSSKKTCKWFKDNRVSLLDWLPQSLDLNSIEKIWVDLMKGVPQNNTELGTAI